MSAPQPRPDVPDTRLREPMSPFESVNHFVDRAARIVDVPAPLLARIRMPDSELRVEVTIRLDDGETASFVGYRVQHNDARGPYKGGLRYHPEADIDGCVHSRR